MIQNIGTKPIVQYNKISFGENKPKEVSEEEEKDYLMLDEYTKHPTLTNFKIGYDKLSNAITTYPAKGFRGSINSNFYEFLTMGTIPYLAGSATLMAVFNLAGKFFDARSKAASYLKTGKKMALGVVFYGVAKSLSKKLIETPVKMKYGLDVNLPYRKVINEIPDNTNNDDLISYEYHRAYESVDFPRFDLLYSEHESGKPLNSYYDMIAKKMGYGENLPDSDQKVKPKMRELICKTKTFSTLVSYLWAATGVGIASQKAWESSPVRDLKSFINSPLKSTRLLGGQFVKACKEFLGINQKTLTTKNKAGIALFGLAAAATIIGNIITLSDSKKRKADMAAAAPIIDNDEKKVVC